MNFDFTTAKEAIELCNKHKIDLAELMLVREMEMFERSRNFCNEKMLKVWHIMKESAGRALKEPIKSMGGLIGGEAKTLWKHSETKQSLCQGLQQKAVIYAMAVMELNASMGLIVAAPTAGSAGVVPGTLLAMQEEYCYSDEEMVRALFVTAAVGYLINYHASVAGAEAGCQAEVGSAAAMAAAAICYLRKEKTYTLFNAASLVMGNLLGLVCDPIKGLVEAPCQQRNAQGACSAIMAADLSLAGIDSVLDYDEMVGVMYKVGKALPAELRETALGGMAGADKFCYSC